MMKFCCEEHVDMAIEDIVDETELPPQLDLLSNNEPATAKCSYCNEDAKYKING